MSKVKVRITDESKKSMFASQLPMAKDIVKSFNSAEDYGIQTEDLKIAARCCGFHDGKIFDAHAEMARNRRVWNAHTEGSEDLDIWIEFCALDEWYGFWKIGVYLTDIWSVTGDNAEEVKSHMYVRTWEEKR